MLWHGGGLTGACWEDTPDGRFGWQSAFLSHGFDVLTSDAAARGRSGWQPLSNTAAHLPIKVPMQSAWLLYRIGPDDGYEDRRAFAETQFPVHHFDQFAKQLVPRFPDEATTAQSAYDRYLAECGPATIVAHSQGVSFAIEAALHQPDKVRALVLVEPGGIGSLHDPRLAALRHIPILIVWG